jgi:ABC-type multidrug transport system ATPase subunit
MRFFGCIRRDEPTSGLDARSALLVTRLLRRLTTNQKRTFVATIHQPSSAVFELFDDILVLRKGGEVIYHGPLGIHSMDLIDYFECEGAVPIELGDNPANWIFRVMQDEDLGDLAKAYKESKTFETMSEEIESLSQGANLASRVHYDSKFATNYIYRQLQVNKRLRTIVSRTMRSKSFTFFADALCCFLSTVLAVAHV